MEEQEIQPELESPEPESPGTDSEVEDPAAARAPEPPVVSMDDWLAAPRNEANSVGLLDEDAGLKAVLEAIVYVAEDPVTPAQASAALGQPAERIRVLLNELAAEFDKPEHGLAIKEVAGGYKMATKAEHHEAVRAFVKSLKPPLKLSLPALETLAVVAYKQPVTSPEIMEIRGVQGAGVLKTLIDRKLIAAAGRKSVIGKPILYKTTKEFLIQFGLKDLSELPTLKEFEELRRMAFSDEAPTEETPETAEVAQNDPQGAEEQEAKAEGETVGSPVSAARPTEEGEAAPSGEAGPEAGAAEN